MNMLFSMTDIIVNLRREENLAGHFAQSAVVRITATETWRVQLKDVDS